MINTVKEQWEYSTNTVQNRVKVDLVKKAKGG